MSEWLLRWQSLPHRWQWLILLAAPLLLLSLLAWWRLSPLQQKSQALSHQYQQLSQQHQARIAQLNALPSAEAQQQQNQQLRAALKPVAEQVFSLVTLVSYGGVIEKWQPEQQGGELTLLLSWPQFQQTLAYLASRQPPVMLQRFDLHRSGERLRLTVKLDAIDEP